MELSKSSRILRSTAGVSARTVIRGPESDCAAQDVPSGTPGGAEAWAEDPPGLSGIPCGRSRKVRVVPYDWYRTRRATELRPADRGVVGFPVVLWVVLLPLPDGTSTTLGISFAPHCVKWWLFRMSWYSKLLVVVEHLHSLAQPLW
jgi:hypothetical protein